MAAPWEAWVLLWLAAFQVAIAAWWWRGPSLPRTRLPIVAAFLLNSVATAASAIPTHLEHPIIRSIGATGDRWADVALLAFAAVAAEEASGRRRLLPAVLPPAAVAALLAMPEYWSTVEVVPGWRLWQELPLLLAMFLVALAVSRWGSTYGSRAAGDAWLLALALLGLRYAEIGTHVFVPRVTDGGLAADSSAAAAQVLGLLAFGALLVGAAHVGMRNLRLRVRPPGLAMVPLLVVAGALIGLAGPRALVPQTLLFLTIALARPVGFLYVQSALGSPAGAHGPGLATLAVLFAASSLGLLLGISAWGLPPPSSALLALAFLLLAAPAIPFVERATRASARARAGRPPTAWPLDPSRVPLPPDWEALVEDGSAQFRRLDPHTQASLTSLSRWQRILLALDAVPPEAPPNAYARTTPGIHLATHCPYAEVGSEIRRANQRAAQILRDVLPGGGAEPGAPRLFEVRWGRAEGLRSGRARFYLLTPSGRGVAARLRADLGLPSPEVLSRVLAESYAAGHEGPPPPARRNPR